LALNPGGLPQNLYVWKKGLWEDYSPKVPLKVPQGAIDYRDYLAYILGKNIVKYSVSKPWI